MTKSVIIVETEVYSRVVGYYRPVKSWNVGKTQEFSDRHFLEYEEVPEDRRIDTPKLIEKTIDKEEIKDKITPIILLRR